LRQAGLNFKVQYPIPIEYKDIKLDCGYRVDIFVEESLILELKSVDHILRIHEAQVITYMKLADISVGLLIDFTVKLLRDGIRRLFPSPSPLSLRSL
jgi:GxxExxY protein